MSNLIFGCGSGRCGTVSLAALLNHQNGAAVTHERFRHRLKYRCCFDLAIQLHEECKTLNDHRTHGDVMGTWIWYADQILRNFPEARVICLRRPREETVKSFLAKKPNSNRWQKSEWDGDPWGETCPWYDDGLTKEEAIGAYWDGVYGEAEDLDRIWDRFLLEEMDEVLNDRAHQRQTLRALGFDRPKTHVGIHKNQGTYEAKSGGH